ncbi:MAG TPA: hydantoinase B/oxoprolinase family protein [Thermoplasmataceae archaeon]|nr:hydantoinase B/oxoprolinase family protein [Thermoplasmataceae archaeon]
MSNFEIIGKATQFIAEEMGVSLKKSAISPNIRERMDHSCAIADGNGVIVAQAEHIPVHLGSFRVGLRNLLKWVQEEDISLKHGEMIITNDPYISGTHMNDVMILAPVFYDGELKAYVVNKAHNVDVGGPVFGSLNPEARNLFQEGTVIPPVKIVKNGKIDSEIFSFIKNNFKDPETADGDINAQVAANRTGISRVVDLFEKFGLKEVLEGWHDLNQHSRELSIISLRSWKKGTFISTDFLEANERLIKLKLSLTVTDSGVIADFAGTERQIPLPLNAVFGVTFSATAFAIRSALSSDIPTNEGFYSIITVRAEPGTIVNPTRPYPVCGGNVETTQRIADLTLQALSQCVEGIIPSGSSGTMFNVMMGGERENGKYWSYYETIGGGNGASQGRDGVSGIHSNMTNTLNTPIEIAEKEYPFYFTAYKLRRGSGGIGRWRGGDGIIRSFIVTRDCSLSVIADRFKIGPYALAGGSKGRPGSIYIRRGKSKRKYGSKFSTDLKAGDEVIILTPGGSGYGKADSE